jgi:hypothetical protein
MVWRFASQCPMPSRSPRIPWKCTPLHYPTETPTKEAIWMTKLMKELGYMKEKKVMMIRCDNQVAISLTKNPTQHARTKHM